MMIPNDHQIARYDTSVPSQRPGYDSIEVDINRNSNTAPLVEKQSVKKPETKEIKEKEAVAALLGLETTHRRQSKEGKEAGNNDQIEESQKETQVSSLARSSSYSGEEETKKHITTPDSASYVSPVSASSGNHEYRDYEDRVPHFPTQLHEVLSSSELSGIALEWLPHGKSWRILRWEGLRRDFLAKYFPQCGGTTDSFMWHVNSWGFREVKRGPDRGSFFHVLFLRDHLKLCQQMPWPISYMVKSPRSPIKGGQFFVPEDELDDETYYYYRSKGVALPTLPGYGHAKPRREDPREDASYRPVGIKPEGTYALPPNPHRPPWKSTVEDEYYLLLQRGQPHPPFHNVFRHRQSKQSYPPPSRTGSVAPDDEPPWLSLKQNQNGIAAHPRPVVTSESQSSTPERDHQPSPKRKASYATLTPPYRPSNNPSRPTPDCLPNQADYDPQLHATPPSSLRSSTLPLYNSVYPNESTSTPTNGLSLLRSGRGGIRRSPFATHHVPPSEPPLKKKFTMSQRGGMKQFVPRIESPPSRAAKVSPEDAKKFHKEFPVAVAISKKNKRKLAEV